MTASQLIYARLTASPELAALVGDRIFPVVIPQGQVYPCVIYQLITRSEGAAFRGGCGPDDARVQVTSLAADYDQMELVEMAVRIALQRYEDGDYSITPGNATDTFEDSTTPQLFSRASDYRVTVPALPVS